MFRALMNNYDQVSDLVKVAADSTGSATKRMEIYLDSVEAKTNQLKATWEEFIMSLGQSDEYKSFIDFGIWFLQNMPTAIGYITAIIVLFKGSVVLSKLKQITSEVSTMFSSLKRLPQALETTKKNIVRLDNGAVRFAKTEEKLAAETDVLNAKLAALRLAISAVIFAISLGIQAYNDWKRQQDEMASAAKEEANKHKEKIDTIEDVIQKYKEITQSGEDYSTRQEELKKLSEDLTEAYGKEAEALDLLNGSYENNLAKMEKKANAERKLKLTDLKTASDLGESNLKNWTNIFYDIESKGEKININASNRESLNKIREIAGDNVKFLSDKYKFSEGFSGGYIEEKTVDNLDAIIGMKMENFATNEEGLKIAQKLQEYLDENANDLDQQIMDMVGAFISKIKSEVDSSAEEQYKNKQSYQLAKLTQNSDGSNIQEIKDYENQLSKIKKLEDTYNKTTDEEKRQSLKEELAKEYEIIQDYIKKIESLYKENDENQSTLSKKTLFNYLGIDEETFNQKSENNIYTGLQNIGKTEDYNQIKKDLAETGTLSDAAKQKLIEIKNELSKQEDGKNFITKLDEDLGNIANNAKLGLQGEDLKESLEKIQNFNTELDKINQGLKNLGLDEIQSTKFNEWITKVNDSLNELGLNVDAKWYKYISEALRKGEISFDSFYAVVSDSCKKLGIDLNDLRKSISGVSEELGMLGSQQSFINEMKKIEDLYSDAEKLKSGKSLGVEDIVKLRNSYKEINDYIGETGDLTLKNGQLLMELGDKAYEEGEDAIQKQIESLEDYQDAILNTVDAMGIMADFKKELAKIDENLAGTITDNAIAEAKAEGMYVDFTKEMADGVYKADETIRMSKDTLYTSEQANIQGLLDLKTEEAAVNQVYSETQLLLDEAEMTSDQALMEQKVDSANSVMESKNLEGAVIAGIAAVETQAESSSAEATAEGANSKADSQQVAAEAAIATGQAFISMAQAIAEAQGIEAAGLNDAKSKLDALEIRAKEIGEEKTANAGKAAAAYAEAQRKIEEAKARLGQYRNLHATGHGNYNSAKSSGGGGSGSSYSAEDAAKDLKDILNDIEKYEQDIELDLKDQTEELLNQYNLRRNQLDTLKEELDYYDSIYDVTENTSKWLTTQLDILDEESKKVAEIQKSTDKIEKQRQKIYNENSNLNVASWFDSEGNETLAYGDLLNSFEYRKNEIEKQTAAAMRDIYNGVSGSTDKDTISDAKERIKLVKEENENRIKAIDKEKEYVENVYSSVSQLNDAWKDNRDAVREALQEMNDRVKSIRDELVDDIMEQLERAVDKMNTSIEKDVTRMEQLVQIQESYNSLLNDTIETQQSLDDELRANMDTYEYLDEQMRQLMFNEDDYKQLSKVLDGVQEDIANIWEDHYKQINDLTEDEMYKAQYITNETERQLAAKQKEYDLARAELEVAKAQTNLQNVLNERNTRIYADGEWSWVANPDSVKQARQELADQEREKTRIEREREQQSLIDSMNKIIDSDNLQIDKNNDLLEKIQEAIELQTQEVKTIEEALLNADAAGLPALQDVLQGALGKDGGYMKELLQEINHSTKELGIALRGQTVEQAINQLKSNSMSKGEFEELTKRLGFSFNPTTGVITTQDGSFVAHYAGWTPQSNADTQLTTAANGVQVTGQSGTNSIASVQANQQVQQANADLEQIARDVWLGKWGNGQDRKNRLTAAGYDYYAVQALVNKGRSYFFDQGGIAGNFGLMAKDTIEPERVLSPRQTKAFETLVENLTTNPVLNALSKVPAVSSVLNGFGGSTDNSVCYNFKDFVIQADNIQEFINSIETMMPMQKK